MTETRYLTPDEQAVFRRALRKSSRLVAKGALVDEKRDGRRSDAPWTGPVVKAEGIDYGALHGPNPKSMLFDDAGRARAAAAQEKWGG